MATKTGAPRRTAATTTATSSQTAAPCGRGARPRANAAPIAAAATALPRQRGDADQAKRTAISASATGITQLRHPHRHAERKQRALQPVRQHHVEGAVRQHRGHRRRHRGDEHGDDPPRPAPLAEQRRRRERQVAVLAHRDQPADERQPERQLLHDRRVARDVEAAERPAHGVHERGHDGEQEGGDEQPLLAAPAERREPHSVLPAAARTSARAFIASSNAHAGMNVLRTVG